MVPQRNIFMLPWGDEVNAIGAAPCMMAVFPLSPLTKKSKKQKNTDNHELWGRSRAHLDGMIVSQEVGTPSVNPPVGPCARVTRHLLSQGKVKSPQM